MRDCTLLSLLVFIYTERRLEESCLSTRDGLRLCLVVDMGNVIMDLLIFSIRKTVVVQVSTPLILAPKSLC